MLEHRHPKIRPSQRRSTRTSGQRLSPPTHVLTVVTYIRLATTLQDRSANRVHTTRPQTPPYSSVASCAAHTAHYVFKGYRELLIAAQRATPAHLPLLLDDVSRLTVALPQEFSRLSCIAALQLPCAHHHWVHSQLPQRQHALEGLALHAALRRRWQARSAPHRKKLQN